MATKYINSFIAKLGGVADEGPEAFEKYCAAAGDKTVVLGAMVLAGRTENKEFSGMIIDICKQALLAEAARQNMYVTDSKSAQSAQIAKSPRSASFTVPPGLGLDSGSGSGSGAGSGSGKPSFAKLAAETKTSAIASAADDGFKPVLSKSQNALAAKFARAGLSQFTDPLVKTDNKWHYAVVPKPKFDHHTAIPTATDKWFRSICSVTAALNKPIMKAACDTFSHEFDANGAPVGWAYIDNGASYKVPNSNYGITYHENNTFSCFREEGDKRIPVSVELMAWEYTPAYLPRGPRPVM